MPSLDASAVLGSAASGRLQNDPCGAPLLPGSSRAGSSRHGASSGLMPVFRLRRSGIGLLQSLPLLVLGQDAFACRPVALFWAIRPVLAGMHDAGVHAPLGQALSMVFVLAGHGSAVALNVPAMRAGVHALLVLKCVLAAFHMAGRALLHLLRVMTGIVHVLVAELAFHDGLLFTWGECQRDEAGHVPMACGAWLNEPDDARRRGWRRRAKAREAAEQEPAATRARGPLRRSQAR